MRRDKKYVELKLNVKEGDYLNASQRSAVKPVYDLFVGNFKDFQQILRNLAGYQYDEKLIKKLDNSSIFPAIYILLQDSKDGEYLRKNCSAANDLANGSQKRQIDEIPMWGLMTLFNAAVEFNKYAIELNKMKEDGSGNIIMSSLAGCSPIKKKELEKYIAIAEKFITAFSAPNKSLRFLETECSKIDRLNKKNQKQDELNTKAELDDDMRLTELVGTAISTDQNFVLTKSQIDIVKTAIGKEEFESAIKAYKLKEEDLTLDNVRMLVIRFLAHEQTEQWLENRFLNPVIKWCSLEQKQDKDSNNTGGTLVEIIRDNPKIWKAVGKEPRNNLISKALNFICKILPARWKFLTSLRFKTNDAFRADFDKIKDIHTKGDNKFFFSATSQVKRTTK